MRRPAAGDGGFSLVEVLVAMAVIGTVMAATAPFLVRSVVLVSQQRSQQAAVEVANDALERARALDPSSLLAGRGEQAAEDQLNGAPQAVRDAFADTMLAGDPLLPSGSGSGVDAPLPTEPLSVTVGGTPYQQHWYVGRCWQVKADPRLVTAAAGSCLAVEPTGAGVIPVPFFRVVVAVTWQHTACVSDLGPQPPRPANECVYVASTLMSSGSDPVFDLNRPPPTIANPGSHDGYVGDAVNLQLLASGGRLPRTWSATGLPAGLSMSSAGLITGIPTTAGAHTVTVQLRDRVGNTDDATFAWTIAQPPALTAPSAQTSWTEQTASLSVAATGGLQPLVWSATGLPAGLSINASTGVISGTPTTVETRTATVTIVDRGDRTASVSFPWQVRLTPVWLYNPGTVDATIGDNAGEFALYARYGLQPYTWQATNLPLGLSLNPSTGVVTGTITGGTRYLTTVVVTDSAGGRASMTAVVNVAHRALTDLRVAAPNPASPDQSLTVGTPVTLTASAAGGTGSYAWAATGMPPGVTHSAGTFTGTPTTAGHYVTALTVTDSEQKVAKLMFTWKVKK